MTGEALELTLEERPRPEDVDRLRRGLVEHSRRFVDTPGFRPLTLFARDGSGRIVGGAYGYVNWTWLDVSLLWVADTHRGRGLGSRILRAFEDAGRDRGCTGAHLDTLSYQAPGFYERHGYEAHAELPDYPPGYRRIFFRKAL